MLRYTRSSTRLAATLVGTLVPVTLLALVLAASCSRPPQAPQSLRYRMPENPPNLDPFRSSDDNSNVYAYPLFDGLVEYAPGTLDVQPSVAESWTVSPDGTVYTFKLRPGVRFHNGRELTADDVVYSIRRALTKRAKSGKDYFFAAVSGAADFWAGTRPDLPGVSAPDPTTVVITLSYPYEKFLNVLASEGGSILPKEVYEDPNEAYLNHPVGCGPFRFESWEPGVSLTLKRFRDHWKKPPTAGALDGIVFRFISDSSTAFEEYRAGGLDFTQEIPPGQRQRVMQEMAADFHHWPRFSLMFVGFNNGQPPLLGNPTLRRAVIHAIDREFIVRVLQEGKDTVAAAAIPPGMLGHDPDRTSLAYDPDLSARLLQQAGYPGGRGLPTLFYRTNDTRGFRLVAERVASDLARVGIRVEVDTSDFGAFLTSMQAGKSGSSETALFRMTWYADWPDPDNFLAQLFSTGSAGNFGRYSNATFDQLMLQARLEPDRGRRETLYREGETLLLEDAAFVPLYWYGQDVLLKPAFKGMKPSLLGTFGIAWEEVVRAP